MRPSRLGRGAARKYGPHEKKKKKRIISISFYIFWGPCQSGVLRIVMTFHPYMAPLRLGSTGPEVRVHRPCPLPATGIPERQLVILQRPT